LAAKLLYEGTMTTTSTTHTPKRSTPTAAAKPLVIKHWMTTSPHSIGRDQTLGVAHKLMREHGLRHLPVLDGGKLVGLLTQRDLYFLESIRGVDMEADRVEDGMSQDVYCVAPDARLAEVVREMAEHKYGCVVVVDAGRVVGVFTTTDAMGLLADRLRDER
jgi:acetoin utilization protein AcuB